MWNLQSGIRRKTFDVGPCPPEATSRLGTAGKKGNERTITGIATDALNRTVIVSTLDGTINVRISCLETNVGLNVIVILVL